MPILIVEIKFQLPKIFYLQQSNHLIQIIRKVSHTKDIRRKLLSSLNDENMALEDVFTNFQEDHLQKVQTQSP